MAVKKERIPAEMFDKMQYILRNYYDGTMHSVFYYDKTLNKDVVEKAVTYVVENFKIYHSTFHKSLFRSYWEVNEDYTVDDYFKFIETDDLAKAENDFITQQVDEKDVCQIKVALIRCNGKDTLCYLINHMVSDGGDLRYIYLTIAKLYNEYLEKGALETKLKDGTRSNLQVYDAMSPEDRKAAMNLKSNVSSVKNIARFPYTKSLKTDKNMIVKEYLSSDEFLAIKAKGKEKGASINDVFVAAYVRAIYDICKLKNEDEVNMSCMVDLRRYMPGGQTVGITNMTGYMPCSTKNIGNSMEETLKVVCESNAKQKADKFMGLYSIPLLNLAFDIFPDGLATFCIRLGYKNPIFGMSNIGIIKPELLKMQDATLVDGWSTGAVKYKPYVQFAMTTFDTSVTMTMASRGNEGDAVILKQMLEMIHKNLQDFLAE